VKEGRSTNSDDNTERRLQCPTAPKVFDLAEPRDAQYWQVWSRPALLVANPALFQAPNRLQPAAGEPREGSVTFQISRRGKEYLETAQTLLQAAQTMTDQHVAGQLKALAEDYERRAEKAAHADAAKALARSAARECEALS
jgi:hypothetical protein